MFRPCWASSALYNRYLPRRVFANLLKRQLKIKISCSCKTPHEKLLWTCTLLESNHVNEKTEMEKRLKRKDCHGDEIKSHAADRKYSKFNRQWNGWSIYYCLSIRIRMRDQAIPMIWFSVCFYVTRVISWIRFFPRALGPGTRFSEVPKIFGPLSGAIIPFISSQRGGSKPSNFAVRLVFLSLKRC